jgi:hypothetical protein
MTDATTGWPASRLMQDDDKRLSRALSNTPHARRLAEEAAAAIVHDHRTGEAHLVAVTVINLNPEEGTS